MELIKQDTNTPVKYGEFWSFNNKGFCSISRLSIDNAVTALGYCLYLGDVYKQVGITLIKTNEREMQDELRNYIPNDIPEYGIIYNSFQTFIQKNSKHIIYSLPIIQYEQLLHDTPTSCYKFFKNGYIQITPIEIFFKDYKNFPKKKLIFANKIQPREYRINPEGKYIDFLRLATDWTNHSTNIMSIIGYLCHEYKDETTGYIIVLTEQCPDPKDGGGSGKNLFCNLLSHSTTYHSKNGSQVKFDEKFFQSWNGQRIMGISDVPKNFNFEFLKEPSTGTFILKKLFKDEIEIPVCDGPKFVVQTNYSFEISDGGLKRRIMPIEFTDFFTKQGGIDQYFGCHFPSGWTAEDWCNYDTIIAASIQEWLSSSRKLISAQLTENGWNKQFEYSYGKNLTEFIIDNFDGWCLSINIPSKEIKDRLKDFFVQNDVAIQYRSSPQKVASAIKEYAKHHGFGCEANVQVRNSLNLNEKTYIFKPL